MEALLKKYNFRDSGRGACCSVCRIKRKLRHRTQEDCKKAAAEYFAERRGKVAVRVAQFGYTQPGGSSRRPPDFVAQAVAEDRARLQRQLEQDRRRWGW